MKITIEGYCAERMVRRERRVELDVTTLAMTAEHCLMRVQIGEKHWTPNWLNEHPFVRVRKVKIETVDEEQTPLSPPAGGGRSE